MFDRKLIKYALATVIAAAGVFSFSAYADGLAVTEPAYSAAAPEDTNTPAPYTAPRYFNPTPPRQDNPTDSPGAWEVYTSPTTRDLYCVDFVDANNGWAGGRSVALRYRNGTWSVIPGHSGHVFEDMDMLSANDGWAVGWDGNKEVPAIWRWDGSDWKEFQNPTGAVYCIDMINNSSGWIGGKNYFLRFNGATWEWGGNAPDIMTGIQMFSDTNGRAVGYNYIMKRNGSNWVQEFSNSNWAVADILMINQNNGWVVGRYNPTEKGWIGFYNGVWRQYKIFNDARTITELDIYGNDFGWCCGWTKTSPPYGAYLGFFDGNNWTSFTAPTDKGLLGIDILDKNNGWIVGIGGVILKYKRNVSVKETSLGKIKAKYR